MRRPRLPRVTEKAEQAAIVQLLRSIGAAVYVLGHPSPSDGRTHRGTGQTAGIPDLFAILPLRAGMPAPRAVWIEVKAKGGQMSPAQQQFQDLCFGASMPHVVGGVDAVVGYLQACGWVRAVA